MSRFWVSWWSDNPVNAETPFGWWDTGVRFDQVPQTSYVGTIDAENECAAWQLIAKWFPDYVQRFILAKPDGWTPNPERFP